MPFVRAQPLPATFVIATDLPLEAEAGEFRLLDAKRVEKVNFETGETFLEEADLS